MKKLIYSVVCLTLAVVIFSCSKKFLERSPRGVLDENTLSNKKGVEALLIGAYSLLDGTQRGDVTLGGWESAGSNWVYGSVAGGDAHKGSDAGDQPAINPIERFEHNAGNAYFDAKWSICFEGITRANATLRVMAKATDITAADITRITGEARFLRGHYYFELKKMFNKVPYIDETTPDFNIPNDADIWTNIEADLKFAYDNLPETMNAKGRANKWAAGALLAKAYMFQKKFNDALTLLNLVYTNGKNAQGQKYALLAKYQDNFNAETKNSVESVFAVQYSVNDGAPDAANGGWGEVLNFPYLSGASPGGCCGFFQPTQDLVNSFQVDATSGLPSPDNYNATEVKNDQGLGPNDPFTPSTATLDARLDWTVGRRGIPFLDWGKVSGSNWIRDQAYSGPYSAKKNTYYKSQQGLLTDKSFWTSGVTANNYTLIRFADVILWLAEAEMEVGSLEKARQYVNEVRARAANPVSWVMDGANPAANYKVGLYTTPWVDKEAARKAIYFERKLEFGMEGHRFFDLVRWGIAKQTLDAYLAYVSQGAPTNKRNYLVGAKFTAGKNEYFPIPQRQIDLSTTGGAPKLKQNPGY
jgi:starch-binding outer membrane protein, SusD/RagB family